MKHAAARVDIEGHAGWLTVFPRASSVYGHMSFAVDCWHLDDVIDGFHQLINTPLIVLIQITSPGVF